MPSTANVIGVGMENLEYSGVLALLSWEVSQNLNLEVKGLL